MRLSTSLFLALCSRLVLATRLIESKALSLCSNHAGITSTHFSVVFTPQNQSLALSFDGISSLSGRVTAELILTVYGYTALRRVLDPCNMGLEGLCPLHAGAFPVMTTTIKLPQSVVNQIPGIAYTVPDLDASVRVFINSTETGNSLSCIEAALSNGKTVYQPGVGWTTAVISGLGVAVSAVTSGMGHSKTATHIATNVLALFGFMQSQATFGMTAVHMPPIVQSWTQNFQWSMGIIRVGFLETLATWYQRSTGGVPSTVLANLSRTSIHVRKRDAPTSIALLKRAAYTSGSRNPTVVRGIQRVGFRAHIELTNIFLTGLAFFIAFVVIVMLLVALCRVVVFVLAKSGNIRADRFKDVDWSQSAKGILFRLVFIGFPQMCVLCLWELTQNDSPAEMLLAAVMLLSCAVVVGFAVHQVVTRARQSVTASNNPAYLLYSDAGCLAKWGILYTQYRATAYLFIGVVLAHTVTKSLFISLSQPAPVVQTVALLIIEASMLVAAGIVRPWMNRKTNVCCIAIAVVNLLNAVFLLIFSAVFDQPPIISGVMGVVFFVYNAACTLILLLMVLVASAYALASKNPDTRYQPMRDDRGSFLRSYSNVQLTTELDALGATARGDVKAAYPVARVDSRPDSVTKSEPHPPPRPQDEMLPPLPSSSDLSMPLFPSETRLSPLSALSQDARARRSPSILRGDSPTTVNSRTALADTRPQNSASP
ncbi:hypothetical protein HFD88_006501 [Aspergillus terreus]|nr:hypothetical protein HFD88_006501 [Aspergillus terreus]